MSRLILLLLAAGLLQACAPVTKHARFTDEQIRQEALYQQRLAIEQELAQRVRLADVSYRLAVAAAPECQGGKPISGMELGGIGLFEKTYQPAAQQLGFDQGIRVVTVATGSPAAKAGIQAGDKLTAINGQKLDEDAKAYRDAFRQLNEAMAHGPVRLSLKRGAQAHTAELAPVRGCYSQLFITRELIASPKANGHAMLVPYSLARASGSADELAAQVAFALAFNVRDLLADPSEGAGGTNRNVQALMGVDEDALFLPAGIPTKRELERADEYAIELIRRAGYDPAVAVNFWRRMAVAMPLLEQDKSWGRHLLRLDRMVNMQKAGRQ